MYGNGQNYPPYGQQNNTQGNTGYGRSPYPQNGTGWQQPVNAQGGYNQQNGYQQTPQQGYQGGAYPYQQGQTGYNSQPAQGQTGYNSQPVQGQTGYAPYGGAGYQQTGYQQTGYAQGQTGYAPPQGQTAYGRQNWQPGFQTQGQVGYTQQSRAQQTGYAPQQGWQQPAQQQSPQQQWQPPVQNAQQAGFVPQQDLGYTKPQPQVVPPQQVPAGGPGGGPRFDPMLLLKGVLCVLIPLLFAASMILTGVPVLKWVFIGLAVVGAVVMWVVPVMSGNTRLTMTIVYVALIVVALVSALIVGGTDTTSNAGTGVTPPSSAVASTSYSAESQSYTASSDSGSGILFEEESTEPTPSPTPDENDLMSNEAVIQLQSFFYFWSVNKTDDMVALCLPSWQSSQESANTALFRILANRTPTEYTVEKISGSANDTSRTVTVTATIDKGNGKDPSRYRLSVIMTKENGTWYVDPRSLSSSEAEETATPTPEPTATPTPATSASTKLYYNPNGGSKYHADPNCSSLADKYKPLTASFTYAEVNDSPYSDLRACNVCNAPLRDN